MAEAEKSKEKEAEPLKVVAGTSQPVFSALSPCINQATWPNQTPGSRKWALYLLVGTTAKSHAECVDTIGVNLQTIPNSPQTPCCELRLQVAPVTVPPTYSRGEGQGWLHGLRLQGSPSGSHSLSLLWKLLGPFFPPGFECRARRRPAVTSPPLNSQSSVVSAWGP